MTVRQLIIELLLSKNELKLDDEIKFYYLKNNELIGCALESIHYQDQNEFTIQDLDEV
jgi:hypothetical protein|tara:strand:- start:4472 stop:4645 length:174 start_codon:yes stop_codon:yes gene_type:complete